MITYSIARSAAERDEVYQLRYRVTCLEMRQEPEEKYPSGREKDRFDPYAIHAIARHFDLITVGTARVVLNTPFGLPLERGWTLHDLQRQYAAELSKLAISRLAVAVSGAQNREVLMGLLLILCRESRARSIQQWCIQLTEGMERLLSRYGIQLIPVGHAPSPMDSSLYMIEIRHLEDFLNSSQQALISTGLRRHNYSIARHHRIGVVTS